MKDPRIAEHAKLLVNYSCAVKSGDFVSVSTDGIESLPLIKALASEIGAKGAFMSVILEDTSTTRAYLMSADEATLERLPRQMKTLAEGADVMLSIGASGNTQELRDVPPAKMKAHAKSKSELFPIRTTKRWCATIHPTQAFAQEARKSYEGYCDFVYNAMLRDWKKMGEEMQVLADRMGSSKKVRIVGKGTDISFSIEGRKAVVEDGHVNLPGGEVYTSPVETTVNGKAYYDMPLNYMGQEVRGVTLVYRNGEIVEHSAEVGGPLVTQLLATDPGARRLGELGIGMNRGINEITGSILFDEKMIDTIHMAIGFSYREAGGTNLSGIHFDMIKSMKEDGTIYFDDQPVYKDGKFVWE